MNGLLICIQVFSVSAALPPKVFDNTPIVRAIEEIREFPEHGATPTDGAYFMAGWPRSAIKELMLQRFEATNAVCEELKVTDCNLHPMRCASLYRVLAFVKDPDGIPCMESLLAMGRGTELVEMWLTYWGSRHYRFPNYVTGQWFEGPEQWSAFFRKLFERADREAQRTAVLYAMRSWLHDPDTRAFFSKFEQDLQTTGEEALIAKVFLHQHGQPPSAEGLEPVISTLRKTPNGQRLLMHAAGALRHPSFIPWLISMLTPETRNKTQAEAERLLQKITFRLDITGQEAWMSWYERYGEQTREDWVKEAVDKLLKMLRSDPEAAYKVFARAVYRWNDRALLPHFDKLARFAVLHDRLLGWINLAYNPYYNSEFLDCANKIIDLKTTDIDQRTNDLLHGMGFHVTEPNTWEAYVHWWFIH